MTNDATAAPARATEKKTSRMPSAAIVEPMSPRAIVDDGRSAADDMDREDLAAEAGYLADLVEWVIQAQSTLHQVRSAADVYPEVSSALRILAIPIRSPDLLDQNVVSGISMVFMRQRQLIVQLGRGEA